MSVFCYSWPMFNRISVPTPSSSVPVQSSRLLAWPAPNRWSRSNVSLAAAWASPRIWFDRHATFRAGLSWSANAAGVKLPRRMSALGGKADIPNAHSNVRL